MNGVPTTTISILRGESTNYAGDEVDDDTAVVEGLPASILERDRQTTEPVSGQARTIRETILQVRGDTDLRTDDRVRDERYGDVYIVVDVVRQQSHIMRPNITAQLTRVG